MTATPHLPPTQIAKDTFLIHDHEPRGDEPVTVTLNSMVIRAAEPVVVDTGVASNEEQFLADVFSLVDPEDIRWVFISHDDIDHTGNLNALMEAAPNATAVINWFMASGWATPSTSRSTASAGSATASRSTSATGSCRRSARRCSTRRRPGASTTRRTGVYWSSDSFATPIARPGADRRRAAARDVARRHQHLRPVREPVARARRRPSLPGHRRPHRAPRPDGDGRLPHARHRRRPRGPGHRRHPDVAQRGRSSPSPTSPSSTRSSTSFRPSRPDLGRRRRPVGTPCASRWPC